MIRVKKIITRIFWFLLSLNNKGLSRSRIRLEDPNIDLHFRILLFLYKNFNLNLNENEKIFYPQKLTACWCLRIRRVKKLIRTTPFGLS